MNESRLTHWILCCLVALVGAAGCSTDTTSGEAAGGLDLSLVLDGEIEIDVVDWAITGNDMEMDGSIDVSAPGSTASVEVFGLPVGEEPYLVELSAVSDDEQVACKGSAEFDVEVGVATPVMVVLRCKVAEVLGAVRVDGKFNICAQLTKMVVSPLQTSVGSDISLESSASDEEDDPIAYLWSANNGSIADPAAPSTTYTCTEAGDDEITVLVTDDEGAYCMSMWTVRVTCVAGVGNPCDDVTCDDDGNECTSEACNPANGQCESSNVSDGTDCDDGAGMCMAGECVAKDLCMDVNCEDDGNDCTAAVCNPDTGVCDTSNVDDGTSCDDDSGMCMNGDCVPTDLCMDVTCEDDGNECTDEACNPANGQCESSNNTDPCDGGNGTCSDGVCEPNPECAVDEDCPDTGNECIDAVCNAGTCGTSNNSDACDGGAGTCNAGVCEPNDPCEGVTCDDTGNDCTSAACNPSTGACETSDVADGTACDDDTGTCGAGVCEPNDLCEGVMCVNDGNDCTAAACNPDNGQCESSNVPDGTACDDDTGTCDAGVCEPNAEVFYEQDFESLDQTSGTALGGAGFLVFGNEFQPDGTPIQGYGPFPAPNGTPGFSSIALGQGGASQGEQVLVIYSDYNNGTNQEAGNLVEANTFQEPYSNPDTLITAADLGTYTFSFDAKRGDINDPTLPRCDPTSVEYTPNPPCDSTALAFIKTLDPGASFATTNFFTVDTTAIPDTWNRYSITLVVDNALIGQLLQFGFAATATNFEPSGVFYDNLLMTVE